MTLSSMAGYKRQLLLLSSGVAFWRKLPAEIKSLPLHLFKCEVKNYIFTNELGYNS